MRRTRAVRACLLLMVAQAALPVTSTAQDAPAPTGTVATWRTSIKIAALLSRAPHAPELFPERTGADSVWRVRTEPTISLGTRAVVNVAYEQRVRWGSGAGELTTAGILPGSAAAPFRVTPLDWNIAGSSGHVWEHEIDRLSLRMHLPRTDITIGRQAIGWGRGVVFGAVDLFSPFSPLEADREWRRGVDAVRADVELTDRSSLDVIAATGQRWSESALAARMRGYAGPVDVELMAGRRGRDRFAGLASSAAIGDAAVHGEVACFGTPSLETDGRGTVWKAVAGGSYRFPIGAGVLTYAEYHYSGFGASSPGKILPLLASADFQERYLRGDTQILSRHAFAAIGSYEQSPDLTWSGQWVLNPADGSGIISPGFTFTVRDDVSVDGHVYVPYGRTPAGKQLRSEYGTAPLAAFLQLRVYF